MTLWGKRRVNIEHITRGSHVREAQPVPVSRESTSADNMLATPVLLDARAAPLPRAPAALREHHSNSVTQSHEETKKDNIFTLPASTSARRLKVRLSSEIHPDSTDSLFLSGDVSSHFVSTKLFSACSVNKVTV